MWQGQLCHILCTQPVSDSLRALAEPTAHVGHGCSKARGRATSAGSGGHRRYASPDSPIDCQSPEAHRGFTGRLRLTVVSDTQPPI
jgi:hypothetical protein